MKLLVLNGPNINMLGIREPGVYGSQSYAELLRLLNLWAQELGVEPSECVVFEDIPAGLLAGIRAGMRTCAVEDTYSEYCMEEKRQLADFVIHDFEDLML